jgi:hypothetical protein
MVLRLTASSASLIEADKSPLYLRFERSSLSRPINKRTLNASKPMFLRVGTGPHLQPLRVTAAKFLRRFVRYDIYAALEFHSSVGAQNAQRKETGNAED